ncbi:MAG: hypothetical protein AAGA57_09795 [Planctomycetota bacterium]
MSITPDAPSRAAIRRLPEDRLLAPWWLDELCPAPQSAKPRDTLAHAVDGEWLRLRGAIPGARSMDAKAVEAAVADLYATLFQRVEDLERPHLLRIWNGLPGISERMTTPDLDRWESAAPQHEPFDRYMAFNAGRSAAFRKHFGEGSRLSRAIPAASAIGHRGDDLQVHVLAGGAPGEPLENPRQVPAYQYSARYGPQPPVFARATRLGDRLFISGTASIVGEQSQHPGDLDEQFRETRANLRAVVECHGVAEAALRRFRIYAPDPADLPTLQDRLQAAFPAAASIGVMRADLCRPNLRVEIEAAT